MISSFPKSNSKDKSRTFSNKETQCIAKPMILGKKPSKCSNKSSTAKVGHPSVAGPIPENKLITIKFSFFFIFNSS